MKSTQFASGIAAGLTALILAVTPFAAEAKSASACKAEWSAGKSSIKAGGESKRDFLARCRADNSASAAPMSGSGQPYGKMAERRSRAERMSPSYQTSAVQFSSEAQAKARCPGDAVVWANTRSRVYHFAGTQSYGNTKRGAYMCERDTAAAGFRAAKREKRPSAG